MRVHCYLVASKRTVASIAWLEPNIILEKNILQYYVCVYRGPPTDRPTTQTNIIIIQSTTLPCQELANGSGESINIETHRTVRPGTDIIPYIGGKNNKKGDFKVYYDGDQGGRQAGAVQSGIHNSATSSFVMTHRNRLNQGACKWNGTRLCSAHPNQCCCGRNYCCCFCKD